MSTGRRLQDDHSDECDEDVLLARAMAGERMAFDLLAERHRASVLRAARAQLGNYHDAEEVTQETFLRAWRALHHLREPARFAAWLGRIVRSRCATFRATWRQPTLPLDELLDSTETAESSPDRSTWAERAALREAVEELTAPHRAALELHYLAGYSINEVAALLDVPAGTVKRRLHASRVRLRQRLSPLAVRTQRRMPLATASLTGPGTNFHPEPSTKQEEPSVSQAPLHPMHSAHAAGASSRVDAQQFAAALARVAPIPGRADRGHVLNSIHFRSFGNQLTLSATDGFRLGQASVVGEFAGGDTEALIPVSAARVLLTVLQQETEVVGTLGLQFTADAVEIYLASGWSVRLPFVEDAYPDLSRIIPAVLVTRVTLTAAELRRAFSLAAQFGEEVAFPFVVLDVSPGQVRCHTRGPAGATLELSVPAEVMGPPGRTVLAKDKVLPLLTLAKGTLELGWEDPHRPVLLREVTAPASDCWVIMPGALRDPHPPT